MRRIRRSIHLLLTILGSILLLYALTEVESRYDRILLAILALVIIEAGIWQVTQSIFPNERLFSPLRKETDYFVRLVRQLNGAAMRVRRDVPDARTELERVHADMHHSVERMLRLAGQTEEELGLEGGAPPKAAKAKQQVAASG